MRPRVAGSRSTPGCRARRRPGVELLAVAAADPVADHREVHVAVHPHRVVHAGRRGIRRSSSSQPQLPPRANTGTPFTLIFSGSAALSTDFTSVQRCAVVGDLDRRSLRAYACSQTMATRSKRDGRAEVDLDPLVVLVRRRPAGAGVAVGGVDGRVRESSASTRWPSGAGPGRCPASALSMHRERPQGVAPAGRPRAAVWMRDDRAVWREVSICRLASPPWNGSGTAALSDRLHVPPGRRRRRRPARGTSWRTPAPTQVDPVEGDRRAEVHLDPLVVRGLGGPAGRRVAVGGVAGPLPSSPRRTRWPSLAQGQVGAGAGAVDDRQRPQRDAPAGGALAGPDAHVPGVLPAEVDRLGAAPSTNAARLEGRRMTIGWCQS